MKTIGLSQGKVALVDDDKYEYLNRWKWSAGKYGKRYYAVRTIPTGKFRITNGKSVEIYKTVLMHHVVFGAHVRIDHIDGDGLNNQMKNLRPASVVENARNMLKRANISSIYKGVSWNKKKNKWHAQIAGGELRPNGWHKVIFLGYFDDEIEAARTYDRAAIKYFGEFAKLNFPKEHYEIAS